MRVCKTTKVDDLQEGEGKEEWADGSVFEGQFKADECGATDFIAAGR